MVGAASATCGEVLTVGAPWGALRPHPRRVQRGIMPGVQLTRVGRLFSPRPRQRHAVSLLQCLNDFCGSTDYVTKSVFFHELGVSRGSAIERSGYHIYIYKYTYVSPSPDLSKVFRRATRCCGRLKLKNRPLHSSRSRSSRAGTLLKAGALSARYSSRALSRNDTTPDAVGVLAPMLRLHIHTLAYT